jgi:hypothetical protein
MRSTYNNHRDTGDKSPAMGSTYRNTGDKPPAMSSTYINNRGGPSSDPSTAGSAYADQLHPILRGTPYGRIGDLPILEWESGVSVGTHTKRHNAWLKALSIRCQHDCPLHASLFHKASANPENAEPEFPDDNDEEIVKQQYPVLYTEYRKMTIKLRDDRIKVAAMIQAQLGRSMLDVLEMDPTFEALVEASNAHGILRVVATTCKTGLPFEENADLTKSNREGALLKTFSNAE